MSTEQIKDLLKEIMKTKDPDLIQLATEMLRSENANTSPEPEPPKQSKPTPEKEFEFVMKRDNEPSSVGGVPVNTTPRTNTFVDDGTESPDIKTPSFTPTERKRAPYKAIEQTCIRCNKTEQTNPTHARENYTCNRCLGK